MAIRFNNSNLSGVDYNLYNIDKFNGVDYTTTPTSVDDSRAIEISNYLPKGNSLVKRNGVSMLFELMYEDKKIFIHDIWENPHFVKNQFALTEHFVFGSEIENGKYKNPRIYKVENMFDLKNKVISISYTFNNTYDYKNQTLLDLEDMYSFAKYFEGRLFILCMGEYLMTSKETYGTIIEPVSKNAYIPTVVSNIGWLGSNLKSNYMEEINILSNLCCVEICKNSEPGADMEYDLQQFFNENIEIVKIEDYEIKNFLGKDDVYINGLGTFSYQTALNSLSKKYLYYNNEAQEGDEEKKYKDDEYIKITLKLVDRDVNENIVEKMRFGVSYGSYGHRDRLFLSGNPDYPNMDIHSCETNDLANAWKDYTYFGDNSYAMIGSSDTAIKGYGFLNNGSMAVFKESKNNVPNLYIRTYEIKQDAEGNYKEIFPITISGLSIDVPINNQIISYGNDLLVNSTNGIYKIMAGESTATQTYNSYDIGYFIKGNLGDNISNSCHIVFKGKLYISREDAYGNKRVYIADENRYGYIDGKRVYEWFVLDGLNASNFYIFDNELYFSNEKGVFKFNSTFEDEWFMEISNANINGEDFSSEVFVNEVSNQIILSLSNKKLQEIVNNENCKEEWETFKKTTKIKIGSNFYFEIKDTLISTEEASNNRYVLNYEYPLIGNNFFVPIILQNILLESVDIDYSPFIIANGGKHYSIESIVLTDVGYQLECVLNSENYYDDITSGSFLGVNCLYQDFWLDINEMYYEVIKIEGENRKIIQYPFSKCILEEKKWFYLDEINNDLVYLGDKNNVFFNAFDLKYIDFFLDFTSLERKNLLRDVVLKFVSPIKSYWRSKFNALGRLDYLKTIDRMTFVADAIRGGKTNVGYRTSFKSISVDTEFYYKNELNFNDVDFSFFTFSSDTFPQTYTSKNKIKNFVFVQFTFESNNSDDSTITSASYRYKYTKNNKGVK